MCTPAMTATHRLTEPIMPRPSLALALAVVATVLTACADPTAPTPRSTSVGVRHAGYLVSCGDKDSTSAQ